VNNARVLVVIEAVAGQPRPSSLEAISAGHALAAGGTVNAVVVGDGAAPAAAAVAASGVARTLVAAGAGLERYTTAAWARSIEAAIAATTPAVVLLAGTTSGRDLGPYLAARAGGVALSDVTAVRWDDGALVATRPVYQGKMLTEVRATPDPIAFVVVRPGSYPMPQTGQAGSIETFDVSLSSEDMRVRVIGVAEKPAGATNLETAETIVVGGRGVGSKENFAILEDLAAAFGAPIGATRAVTDLGWRPHYEQIGQTGKNVRPKLYIGVGVSGAVQHTVGMRNAETIVVINRDPDAPIFRLATIGVVGDLNEIVPALAREVRAARGG
jgi:electron transfer flavoprotein alpha subunit